MSEKLKESLSAVIDGEADDFETRRVLDEAASDTALRGVWERYHLARSVMRGEGRMRLRTELGDAFWDRVDADAGAPNDDPAAVAGGSDARPSPWNQRLVGVAVAAGVAAAVIIGVGREGDTSISAPPAQVAVVANREATSLPVVMVGPRQIPTETVAVQPSASDLQRARAYMLHHAQQVALTNQARAVPFVKVAAFESR